MKRATRITTCTAYDAVISIHALVKRATGLYRNMTLHAWNFNPRPREEGDRYEINISCDYIGISIHALVKRATANLYNDYLYFEAKYHISDIFPQYNH